MHPSRLSLAADAGLVVLPAEGTVLVLRPRGDADLSALPPGRVVVVQGFRPDHDALADRGFRVVTAVEPGPHAAAVVFVPRSKTEARGLVAAAAAAVVPGGPIVLDGQKTDGIEGLAREIRARAELSPALAKAHGKLYVLANPGGDAFAGWALAPGRIAGGFVTHPAAFSADAVDAGSAALAAALPARLPARVADLGAGWGYLASELLRRDGVEEVHLVEAEHAALGAARQNLRDPRAVFHWADATRFDAGGPFGAVVTNPPFHVGREADPGLGRAFIAAAAGLLMPTGTLWLVANRHLPYERTLAETFREVEELPGPAAYKIYRASGPRARPSGPRRHRPDARTPARMQLK